MYLWLANIVLVVHGMLVFCVVTGMLAAIPGILRRYPRLEAFVYFLLGCVLLSQILRGECVLTALEKYFRNIDLPGSAYRNSCMGHYLTWIPIPVINFVGPTLFALGLLAVPFWRLYDRRQRRRAHLTSPH